MYELVKGRPQERGDRQEKEMRVYDFLDKLGVNYERIDHEPLMTMEACAKADAVINAQICKNLLLRNQQKTTFYLLMMPGDKKFKTKDLTKQLGCARLSFAEPEYMERYLDIVPGSLSVLGLMNDKEIAVRLLMDEETLAEEYLGVHPCQNTSTLRIRTKDLLSVILPATGHDYTAVSLPREDAFA